MNGRWLMLLSAALLLAGCTAPPRYPERLVFPPLAFDMPVVEKRELSGGTRLYLREDRELPLVEITAMVAGGSIDDPADRTGLTELLAAALRSGGAGDRTPEELERELEKMAAELTVQPGTYEVTLRLSLRATDLERGLELLADLLLRPRFDAARLEVARRQQLEGIRRRNDDPGSLAQRLLMEALYAGHPLGRSPVAATVQPIRREELLERHRRQFRPSALWLGISGDFDSATLPQHLEQLLAGWPPGTDWRAPLPPAPAAGPAVALTAQRSLPQTTLLLGAIGIDKDAPDLHAVRLMNYLLGSGGFNSDFMREIRSNRGLAYSAYSSFQIGRRLPGPFIAGAETKTASTVEVIGLMQQLMRQMAERPVDEARLQLAKDSLIHSFVFAFEGTHSVVEQQLRLDFYGYPPDYMQSYRRKVAAVTPQEVQEAARRRLRPEAMTIVLVGDMGAMQPQLQTLPVPLRPAPLD